MTLGRSILLALLALSSGTAYAQTAPNQGGPMGEWARMVEVSLSAPIIVSENSFRVFVRYTPNPGRELGVIVLTSHAFLSDGGTCEVIPKTGRGEVVGIAGEQGDDAGSWVGSTFGDLAKPIVGSIQFYCGSEVLVDQKVTIQLKSWIRVRSNQEGQARHVFNQLQLVPRRRIR